MKRSILERIAENRTVLFDGALGTEIMRRGSPSEHGSEIINVEDPGLLKSIHADYFAAGCDVATTNSFGANRIKLAGFGLGERAGELNLAAARLASEIRPEGRFIAGSMGPTGAFLEPLGDYSEDDFISAYREQALALAEGGVDLFLLETQYDLREAICGLKAVERAAPGMPVVVTMTFKKTPKGYFTFMGMEATACVRALQEAGAAAVGANCTLIGRDMVDLVKTIRPATSLPLLFQPNAGQPVLGSDGRAGYDGDTEGFAASLKLMVEAGAEMVGGCCGTDPGYILAARRVLS